jgi:hypothetical protein
MKCGNNKICFTMIYAAGAFGARGSYRMRPDGSGSGVWLFRGYVTVKCERRPREGGDP